MVSAIAAISTTGLIDYELYTGSVNVRLVQDRLLYGLILRFGRWIKNRSTGIYFPTVFRISILQTVNQIWLYLVM